MKAFNKRKRKPKHSVPCKRKVINYDEVTRTELAPERVRKEKYDLNSLLN